MRAAYWASFARTEGAGGSVAAPGAGAPFGALSARVVTLAGPGRYLWARLGLGRWVKAGAYSASALEDGTSDFGEGGRTEF